MNLFKKIVINAVFSALTFWLPDTFLHFLSSRNLEGAFFLSNLWCPLFGIIGFIYLDIIEPIRLKPLLRSVIHIFGIWVFGFPVFMLNSSFYGAGFYDLNIGEFAFMSLIFPFSTFSGSLYDGSLGGLTIYTLSFLVYFCIVMIRKLLIVVNNYRQKQIIHDYEGYNS